MGGGAAEVGDLFDDVVEGVVVLAGGLEALFAEEFVLGVLGFGDAVADDDEAIAGFEVDEEHLAEFIHRNPIIATVLNPTIGYDKAAEVVKKALKEKKTVKQVVVEMKYLSTTEANRILDPAIMTKPGFSGKSR